MASLVDQAWPFGKAVDHGVTVGLARAQTGTTNVPRIHKTPLSMWPDEH